MNALVAHQGAGQRVLQALDSRVAQRRLGAAAEPRHPEISHPEISDVRNNIFALTIRLQECLDQLESERAVLRSLEDVVRSDSPFEYEADPVSKRTYAVANLKSPRPLWKKIFQILYYAKANAFNYEDINSIAGSMGHHVKLSSLRPKCLFYVENGVLLRTRPGSYSVSEIGVQYFDIV
ncbi:hypothetical protein [Blastomonas sp.]|uniref:hypothetical protein n=1 Tax=Blastomonas sp. TaxID=1909299 RepID=UPI002604D79C|nr:hypothetical protein [Blastomonas sp.]MDM7957447.1 hypothetical protein [Blastomonas sp.]